MESVVVTEHAVERYRERVKPAFDLGQARDELERMLRLFATVSEALPVWAFVPEGMERPESWALIGDGIAVPLVRHGRRLCALTVLCRGGMSEGEREYWNRHRAARRARVARLRQKHVERSQAKRAKRSGEPRREAA